MGIMIIYGDTKLDTAQRGAVPARGTDSRRKARLLGQPLHCGLKYDTWVFSSQDETL